LLERTVDAFLDQVLHRGIAHRRAALDEGQQLELVGVADMTLRRVGGLEEDQAFFDGFVDAGLVDGDVGLEALRLVRVLLAARRRTDAQDENEGTECKQIPLHQTSPECLPHNATYYGTPTLHRVRNKSHPLTSRAGRKVTT